MYKIKLGDGVSEGLGSEQLGLALGESAGVGFSISKGTKQCCDEKKYAEFMFYHNTISVN